MHSATPRTVVLVLLTLGVLVPWSTGPICAQESVTQKTSGNCSAILLLLDHGLLDEARFAYAELDTRESDPACVAEFRNRLSAEYLRIGNAFQKVGERDKALEAYRQALELRPEDDATRQALLEIAGDPFAPARRLAELGEVDRAQELAQGVVENRGRELPEDLELLFGGPIGWWRTVHRAWNRWALPLLEILLMFAVAALLLWLGYRATSALFRWKLLVQPFEDEVREAPSGSAFGQLLQAHLTKLARGEAGAPHLTLTSQTTSINVPDLVGDLSPRSKPIVDAANALLGQLTGRIHRVTGALHRAGDEGPGVTIQLHRGNRAATSVTLWASDFVYRRGAETTASPAQYYLLSEMAAVWLLYALGSNNSEEDFQLLGARSWKAFALFRRGLHAQERLQHALDPSEGANHRREALHWYTQALREDSRLYAASVNMAQLLWWDPDRDALDLLRSAIARMEDEGVRPDRANSEIEWNTAWEHLQRVADGNPVRPRWFHRKLTAFEENAAHYYRIRHALLAQQAAALIGIRTSGASTTVDSAEVKAEIMRFARDLEQTTGKLEQRCSQRRRRSGLRARDRRTLEHLRRVAKTAQPVALSIEIELVGPEDPNLLERICLLQKREIEAFDGILSFNVAYLLSFLAFKRKENAGDTVNAAVECLYRSYQLEPNRRREPGNDPLLRHLQKTDAYQRRFPAATGPPKRNSAFRRLLRPIWQVLTSFVSSRPVPQGQGLLDDPGTPLPDEG